MTEAERELDLQLADAQRENMRLKRQLESAISESLALRHKLEHIYAICTLALDRDGGVHDDKASY